jgi:hypothetical protein
VTAFVVGGVSVVAGMGAAAASAEPGSSVPGLVSTCLLPLPLPLLCDEPSDDSWSSAPAPSDSWSNAPKPEDSWSSGPGPEESGHPWRPADEDEHKVPRGHPETGGGGLAQDGAVWPFALGGAALLTGAGLTGFAVRRRKGVV